MGAPNNRINIVNSVAEVVALGSKVRVTFDEVDSKQAEITSLQESAASLQEAGASVSTEVSCNFFSFSFPNFPNLHLIKNVTIRYNALKQLQDDLTAKLKEEEETQTENEKIGNDFSDKVTFKMR